MPVNRGQDSKGPFYRWGKDGKRYRYTPNNSKSRNAAKRRAWRQGVAIKTNQGR